VLTHCFNTASLSIRSTKKQNGGATDRKGKHLNDGAMAFETEHSEVKKNSVVWRTRCGLSGQRDKLDFG